jgi:hypothetical protein
LSDYAPIVTGRSGIIDLVEPDDSTAAIILPGVESDARAQDVAELINAYWDDNELYCKTFFPKTCRQESAPFHARMDHALWSRRRKVAIKVFRAGAKTTRVRIFLSKRIAYGVSRTILYISKSEGTALATVDWLKRLVETQSPWAVFWGIQKGKVRGPLMKRSSLNTILNVSVVIKAVGIHGQIRGLNFDDYRPDLDRL